MFFVSTDTFIDTEHRKLPFTGFYRVFLHTCICTNKGASWAKHVRPPFYLHIRSLQPLNPVVLILSKISPRALVLTFQYFRVRFLALTSSTFVYQVFFKCARKNSRSPSTLVHITLF